MDYEIEYEEASEKLDAFLTTICGGNVEDQIREKYPTGSIFITKVLSLPELVKNEVWCCECGCGEIEPVEVVSRFMSIFNVQDELVELHLYLGYGSPHLTKDKTGHQGLFVWNTQTDVEVCGKYVEGGV